jgi:hypothetical protein
VFASSLRIAYATSSDVLLRRSACIMLARCAPTVLLQCRAATKGGFAEPVAAMRDSLAGWSPPAPHRKRTNASGLTRAGWLRPFLGQTNPALQQSISASGSLKLLAAQFQNQLTKVAELTSLAGRELFHLGAEGSHNAAAICNYFRFPSSFQLRPSVEKLSAARSIAFRVLLGASQASDVGSIPIPLHNSLVSDPDTWVTERTSHIGNFSEPNGFSSGSSTSVPL